MAAQHHCGHDRLRPGLSKRSVIAVNSNSNPLDLTPQVITANPVHTAIRRCPSSPACVAKRQPNHVLRDRVYGHLPRPKSGYPLPGPSVAKGTVHGPAHGVGQPSSIYRKHTNKRFDPIKGLCSHRFQDRRWRCLSDLRQPERDRRYQSQCPNRRVQGAGWSYGWCRFPQPELESFFPIGDVES